MVSFLKYFLLTISIILFSSLITQHASAATTYGTCTGSTGQGVCYAGSYPSGDVVFYQEATSKTQCGINGTLSSSISRGTPIYCCKNKSGTTYGTCTGATQGYCELSSSSSSCGTVYYSDTTEKTQCGINGTKANLARGTIMYCVCDPTKQTCPKGTPTPTPTPKPSGPTATPTPAPHTKINLALQLAGIGSKGNLSPKHPTRTVHVQIYKKGDDPSQPNISPVKDITNATVTFNSGNGYFLNAALDLGTLATGDYQILVKTTGYLRKEVVDAQQNNVFTLTAGTTTTLPAVALIAGDTAPLYNTMDTSDFYAIVDCYGAKASTSSCAAGSQITDLNDDGHIDGVDLNLWLLGMQTLLSNNNSAGTGDGVPGN